MKRFFSLLAALAIGSLLSAQEYDGQSCTSIMVGRKASTDGSVMTSHTCDGRYRTWAQMEPAADHAPGTMHEVLRGTMHTSFRGDTTGVKLMGVIPEAAHTYAYLNKLKRHSTCYQKKLIDTAIMPDDIHQKK